MRDVRGDLEKLNSLPKRTREAFLWYIEQFEQMQALLKKLEYSATEETVDYDYEEDPIAGDTIFVCPVCRYEEGCGHDPNCQLAKLLGKS